MSSYYIRHVEFQIMTQSMQNEVTTTTVLLGFSKHRGHVYNLIR